MSTQVGAPCNAVDGRINVTDADIDELNTESGLVGMPNLIEDNRTAQSRLRCKALMRGDVILNERLADGPHFFAERLGNTHVGAAVEGSSIRVCIELVATELVAGKCACFATAGRPRNHVHEWHELSSEIPIGPGKHIGWKVLFEAIAFFVVKACLDQSFN